MTRQTYKTLQRWGFLLVCLLATLGAVAQSYTLSGTVRDGHSGETLIGATIYDMSSGKGVRTNNYGRFSLTLPRGEVRLRVSYVGFALHLDTFLLAENREYNVTMHRSTTLQAVQVRAEKTPSYMSSQISAIEMPVEQIKAVPVLFGETDVLKALQLLPGVQSGTEGMAGMYVRGGGPDQNLFLLDGVPLYNVNHLGGFFSAFNADAVKSITLYKGSFPAHFGGRLSSVLDLTTNDGNFNEIHGSASVGIIAAKFNLEGPIVKNKTTFNVSGRRTYGDILIQPLVMSLGASEGLVTNLGYYFYDLNGKVTHKFNEDSRLIGSFYMGDDVIYARFKSSLGFFDTDGDDKEYMKLGYNWGNIVTSLRWNYVINPKLFMDITGAYTRYRNDIDLGVEEMMSDSRSNYSYQYDMSYNSGIQDIQVMADFAYHPNPDHTVKFGGTAVHHIFTPHTAGMRMEESEEEYGETPYHVIYDTIIGVSRVHANELTAYVEDDWTINDVFKINAGVNLAGFAVQGAFYPSLQPRVSGRVLLSDDLSLKVGYSKMTQYMHLLSNSSLSLPSDLWVPVTAQIEPMKAHQVAAGLFYNFRGLFDASVEGYYKSMHNMLEYKDGSTFFSNSDWQQKVAIGDGWSYGVEFLLQRTIGEVTGWLGYTWSHTMRQFDREGMELNNGEPFPAKYDRRHDLSLVISYKPNKRFDCSATWVFSSGNVATVAMQQFEDPWRGDSYYYEEKSKGEAIDYVESRNNFRLPAYHRLDVGVNFHKERRHGLQTISLSVYNLYNRKNPFIAYRSGKPYIADDGTHYGASFVQLALFPIIPSISYSFKF